MTRKAQSEIDRVVRALGGVTKAAKAFDVSKTLVAMWRSGEREISIARCVQIEQHTKGAFRCERLAPHHRATFRYLARRGVNGSML